MSVAGESGPVHDFVLWAIGALTAGIAALAARIFTMGSRITALEVEVKAITRLEGKIDRVAECLSEMRVSMARALNLGSGEGRA